MHLGYVYIAGTEKQSGRLVCDSLGAQSSICVWSASYKAVCSVLQLPLSRMQTFLWGSELRWGRKLRDCVSGDNNN